MADRIRRTGIDCVGDVPWGTHLCQFYECRQDLTDLLVPYFRAGLENNEFCMWVVSEPLDVSGALAAARQGIPDFDCYLQREQIQVVPYDQWYVIDGVFDLQRVLNGWVGRLERAMARGYDGMRVSGNTAWLERRDWERFVDYEEAIDSVVSRNRMLALCTYALDRCSGSDVLDVLRNHRYAIIRQEGEWGLVESSELKRARSALQETADYLEKLFNHANAPIIVWDPDFRITRFNRAFERLTGHASKHVIGRELSMLFPGASREESLAKISRTLAGEHWESVEIPILCRDGTVRLVLWNSANVYAEDGETLLATIAQGQDITERKRAEQELLKLSRAVEQSPATVVITDLQGNIEYVNPKFCQLTGYTAEEAMGQNPRILKSGMTPQEEYRKLWTTIMSGGEWRGEFLNKKKNGELYWESASISPIRNAEGTITHFLAVKEDITERKKAEEEIRKLNADLMEQAIELKAVNAELEAFSFSVSHDLRAPLRGIDGFSQALLEDYGSQLDAQGMDYLQRVRASTLRMNQLIDALLSLSRVTLGDLRREPVDLSALARVVAEDLQAAQPERSVEFAIEPGLVADGDPRLLRLVLENLLGNAWKFTGRKPKARIQFSADELDGRAVYFVRDNGTGFDMAYADKLFGPFQRLHGQNEFPGTGIGLATVQRIIRRHGGRVWAEGEPGRGATFYFTL